MVIRVLSNYLGQKAACSRAVFVYLILCPISATKSFGKNTPRGRGRTTGDKAALSLSHVLPRKMLFCPESLNREAEERFHNPKNVISLQGFGGMSFLLPYLPIGGRGEKEEVVVLENKTYGSVVLKVFLDKIMKKSISSAVSGGR